jgi:hypothetical protein
MKVHRQTVDLSGYPDLVVIYLGIRLNALKGIKMLLRLGPQVSGSVAARPDGLLLHENITYSMFPLHVGMRQYWRDFASLEKWSRSAPHRNWWTDFLKNSGGTGFWHETYFMRGGVEAIYDDVPTPVGMMAFAPVKDARGPMYSSAMRAGHGAPGIAPVVSESDLYGK